jgi:ribonuclease P protein component
MRFRPEQHLRRQSDIRAVREQGMRVDCRAYTLWCLRRTGTAAPGPRLCVAASTAAVGGAILRNRAKRRLREVFRQNQREAPAGCDFLLSARAAVNRWTFPELERKFIEACRQIASSEQHA